MAIVSASIIPEGNTDVFCITLLNQSNYQHRLLLNEYSKKWNSFYDGVGYLNKLFSALNSRNAKKGMFDSRQANRLLLSLYGLLGDESKLEVSSMALKCWRDKLIEPLNKRLLDALVDAMQADRQEVTYRQHIHVIL